MLTEMLRDVGTAEWPGYTCGCLLSQDGYVVTVRDMSELYSRWPPGCCRQNSTDYREATWAALDSDHEEAHNKPCVVRNRMRHACFNPPTASGIHRL
jgi:hypothetical protein